MDIPSVVVGAVIGALVSVPVTIFIQDPLRALVRRIPVAVRSLVSGAGVELENHASSELRRVEELEAELNLRKKRLDRTRTLLGASRSERDRAE